MAANCMGWCRGEKKSSTMTWEDYGKESKDAGTDSEAQSHSSRQLCEHCDQSTLQSARPMAHTEGSRESPHETRTQYPNGCPRPSHHILLLMLSSLKYFAQEESRDFILSYLF